MEISKEPQYQPAMDEFAAKGPVKLGPMMSATWRWDARRLGIVLARYKFVAKMLAGKKRVLEVGCGDGFGMGIVLGTVGSAYGVDFDAAFVAWANQTAREEGLKAEFAVLDLTTQTPPGEFDAAYSLDVIEHVAPADEAEFIANIARCLLPNAVCVIGTPNITAAPYASPASQEGHINLKSAESLRHSLAAAFEHVFVFSMNDEIVHTGYFPMAHYLMALCVNPLGRG